MIQFASSEDPPAARNGVVRPVSGIRRVTPPITTKHCSAIAKESPVASSLPKASRVPSAARKPRVNSSRYIRTIAKTPIRPELLAEGGDDHVAVGEGDEVGPALAEAGADQPAVGHAEQALDDLEAAADLPAVDLIGEGVEPAVDPQRHVREDAGSHEAAHGNQDAGR